MAANSLLSLRISPCSSHSACDNLKLSTSFSFHRSSSFTTTCTSSSKRFSCSSSSLESKRVVPNLLGTGVVCSLPTAGVENAALETAPKWSARAIKSFAMAELEARKLKYPNTGTESLLMGILVEGTSLAAKILRENGITLFKVREETVNLLGKSDMYYSSPEHPPLSIPAQRALDQAISEKLRSGESGEVTATCLLLGVWSETESAGHRIMAKYGFTDDKAKELAKYIDQDIAPTNQRSRD